MIKVNAAEILRSQLEGPRWRGEPITFSGNTDCYQPLEAVYGLTRRCLEVCAEFRNPVDIITKGALIRRDVDLLAAMARRTSITVFLSIPFSDDGMARAIEPGASAPSQRFETLERLARAGIPTGVGVAPVIPGLNDSQIAEVLTRARRAGAEQAFLQALRLPGATLPVFRERLDEVFPQRARRIWNAIQQIRDGKWNETAFGDRMRGAGPRWAAIEALFEAELRRLGFRREGARGSRAGRGADRAAGFRRPTGQGDLFEL